MNLWERIKNNKLVLGFLVFDLIAIIILIILNILNLFRSATIDISVVPLDATVTINGKKYDNNSSYNVFPSSNAKIEISHPDLESKTFTVDLKKDETNIIRNYLVGKDNSFSFYTLRKHYQDYTQLEKIASLFPDDQKLQAFVKSFSRKSAIFEALPFEYAHYDEEYNYTEYTVKQATSCRETLCLEINDVNGNNEENAKALIRENGFNPDDYQYVYNYKPIEELEE